MWGVSSSPQDTCKVCPIRLALGSCCSSLANKHELNKCHSFLNWCPGNAWEASIDCSPQALGRLHFPWHPPWGGTIEMCSEGKFPTPGYSTAGFTEVWRYIVWSHSNKKGWKIKFPGMLAGPGVVMSRNIRSRTACTVLSMQKQINACCLALYHKHRYFQVN